MAFSHSPSSIMARLETRGLRPQKQFGQNFLVDEGVRRSIVDALELAGEEAVWEIGPGLGSLTQLLIERTRSVVAFEVDRGFVRHLEAEFSDRSLRLVAGDFLKTWKEEWSARGAPDRIVGNLPYNIAAPVMTTSVEHGLVPPVSVYTIQKEVADRIIARPGDREYGSLSVFCQALLEVEKLREVSPQCFYPRPNVHSAVVRFRSPDGPAVSGEKASELTGLLRLSFSSRRKTLANNLLARYSNRADDTAAGGPSQGRERIERSLAALGVDRRARAEELRPEDFLALLSLLRGEDFTDEDRASP